MDPSLLPANPDAEERPASAETPTGRRRPWRFVLFGGLLSAVLLGGGAVGGWIWLGTSYRAACREAASAQDWPRVEELAERWSTWQGGKAEPWIFLAEAAQGQGDLERTVAILDRLPDGDPLSAPALLEQSNLLFGPLNRPIQGAAACERALSLNPQLTEAYRRLVYFYAYTLQRRQMVQTIYAALERGCDLPETYLYLIAQDYISFANAYEENTKWLAGTPGEELFQVAQTIHRIRNRETEAAAKEPGTTESPESTVEPDQRKILADCFAKFPQNLELIVLNMQMSSSDGDVERVAELLSSAPPKAIEDNRFWRYKGWVHSVRGEVQAAIDAYRKALEINPYDALSRHQWASVERRLGHSQNVEILESLFKEGQELRNVITVLPDVTLVDRLLLQRIAKYTALCGDTVATNQLHRRLEGTGI